MDYEKGITKKSDMKEDITYILCPDPSCQLFFKPDCNIPCENNCPKQGEMKKIVFCRCGRVIVLNGHHCWMQRVDCNDCGASLFFRMSGKYQLIYERPR